MKLADAVRFVIDQRTLCLRISHEDFGDSGVAEPTVTILDVKTKTPPEASADSDMAAVQKCLSRNSYWFLHAGKVGLVTLQGMLEALSSPDPFEVPKPLRRTTIFAPPTPPPASLTRPSRGTPQDSRICDSCPNLTTNKSRCTDCQRRSETPIRFCCPKCWSWNCHGHRILKNDPERTERRNRRMHRLRSWWDPREGWEMHRSVQFQWRRS